jgi:hypothetical protein
MHAGEVIAKLAEDAYFMRVDNRVTQAPPVMNRDNEATSRSADLGRNRTRAELPANPVAPGQRPADPLKVATAPAPQAAIARSSLTATLAAWAAVAEAPTRGLTRGSAAEAIAAAEATRTAMSPEPRMAASTPAKKLRNCNGRSPPP